MYQFRNSELISTGQNTARIYRVSNKSGNGLVNNDGENKLLFCVTTDQVGRVPARVKRTAFAEAYSELNIILWFFFTQSYPWCKLVVLTNYLILRNLCLYF